MIYTKKILEVSGSILAPLVYNEAFFWVCNNGSKYTRKFTQKTL